MWECKKIPELLAELLVYDCCIVAYIQGAYSQNCTAEVQLVFNGEIN